MAVNEMNFKSLALVSVLFLMLLFSSGCVGSDKSNNSTSDVVLNEENSVLNEVEKIEVIHFHGNNQCWSCITMGDLAEETVNTYFKDELESGKITFQHMNGELSENYDIVKKYGVTSSSLWLGVYYKDGTFSKEQNINVWYKLNNKEDFMAYLKGVIEQKLG